MVHIKYRPFAYSDLFPHLLDIIKMLIFNQLSSSFIILKVYFLKYFQSTTFIFTIFRSYFCIYPFFFNQVLYLNVYKVHVTLRTLPGKAYIYSRI